MKGNVSSQVEQENCAVMYLRGSPVRKQRDGCLRIADKFGLIVVREYNDHLRPSRLAQQHALRRLLDDLERLHDAAHVIVWEYPILSRDLRQISDIEHRLHDCGARIVTITGVAVAERFIRSHRESIPGNQPP